MKLRYWNLLLVGVLISTTARADFADLYTAGHADLAVGYDDTQGLHFFYEFSSTAVVNGTQVGGSGAELDPSSISVIVPELVLTSGDSRLPDPFANNPLYLLLQSAANAAARPFLGFGAEEIPTGLFSGDVLQFVLTGFTTTADDGQFILYSTGNWASPEMNTADGLSIGDSIDIFVGGHDHYNLGFTAAGIYDLELTAIGTLAGGGELSTSSTFRFVVGDQPSPAVPEPTSLVMAGLAVIGAGLVTVRRRMAVTLH